MFFLLSGPSSSANLFKSIDCITWTSVTLPVNSPWHTIAYGGEQYLMSPYFGGDVIYSSDTINWSMRSFPFTNGATDLIFVNGQFIAACGSRIVKSIDGISWTSVELQVPTFPSAFNPEFIVYGNGVLIATRAGDSNVVAKSICSPVPPSEYICTWPALSAPDGGWSGGIFSNGKFLLFDRLDNARVMTSTNGNSWAPVSLPSYALDKLNYFSNSRNPIAYGNGIYLTLATNFLAYPPRTIVTTSSDGITWNISLIDTQIFPGAPSGYPHWSGVAFGAGKFVITYVQGSGMVGIVTTTDGSDLTYRRAVATDEYSSVKFVNGYFFMLSYGNISNKLLYSNDGLDWLSSTLPNSIVQWNIVYVFGQWFMIDELGRNDKLFVSTDLTAWTIRLTGFGNSEGGSIVAGDNVLLSYGSGIALYTSDGVVWQKCPGSVGDNSTGDIIFGNNTFIATKLFNNNNGSLYRAISQ
jgi:hypothetical protein